MIQLNKLIGRSSMTKNLLSKLKARDNQIWNYKWSDLTKKERIALFNEQETIHRNMYKIKTASEEGKLCNRKINTISAFLIGGLTVLLSIFPKAPFKELPQKFVKPIVKERLESVALQSQKILEDSKYKKFGKDTLAITIDLFSNPKKFLEKINNSAAANIPDTVVGKDWALSFLSGGGKSTPFVILPQKVNKYENLFTNARAVIKSNKIFTKNGNDMFIPVEYYGIKNPNIK